jgi:hypothetical protein
MDPSKIKLIGAFAIGIAVIIAVGFLVASFLGLILAVLEPML